MRISLLIKFLVAGGVLYYLAATDAIDLVALADNRLERWDHIAFVMICLFGGILLGGIRWWLILRAADVHLPLRSVLSLQLIGAFFSTWLPGAAGGDAARSLYLFKDLDSKRTTALLTVMIDRAFALFGLVAVASLCAVLSFEHAADQPVLVFYAWLTVGLLALGIAGAALLVAAAFLLRLPQLPTKLGRMRSVAHQIRNAVKVMSRRWPLMLLCALISCVACVLVALGIVVISQPFSFAPDPVATALAGVIGNISSAIPITPGGIGVGEAVFSHVITELTGLVGPFATIYLSFRVWMAAVSFTGAFFWLSRPAVRQRPHQQSGVADV